MRDGKCAFDNDLALLAGGRLQEQSGSGPVLPFGVCRPLRCGGVVQRKVRGAGEQAFGVRGLGGFQGDAGCEHCGHIAFVADFGLCRIQAQEGVRPGSAVVSADAGIPAGFAGIACLLLLVPEPVVLFRRSSVWLDGRYPVGSGFAAGGRRGVLVADGGAGRRTSGGAFADDGVPAVCPDALQHDFPSGGDCL